MKERIRKKRYKHDMERAGYDPKNGKGQRVYEYRSQRCGDGFWYVIFTAKPKTTRYKACSHGWKNVWNPWSIKYGVWTGLPRDKDGREQYLIEHGLKENDDELYTED